MNKTIILKNKKVDYKIRKSKRAKRLRLTVYCDGSLVITKPKGLDFDIIEKFIIKKSNWVLSKLEYFKKFKGGFLGNNRKNYLENKDEALKFVNDRIRYFNKIYNFKFNKINIKNQKTRWGSCSSKGNLNFNYKVLMISQNIADYIIVHELCHLKELNHSSRFWNLISKAIPDYLSIKKELQEKGLNFY